MLRRCYSGRPLLLLDRYYPRAQPFTTTKNSQRNLSYLRDQWKQFTSSTPESSTGSRAKNNNSSKKDKKKNKSPHISHVKEDENAQQQLVVDCLPKKSTNASASTSEKNNNNNGDEDGASSSSNSSNHHDFKRRLPRVLTSIKYQDEFCLDANSNQKYNNYYYNHKHLATVRILRMALHRVLEPPTLHLLAASGCTVLGIGMVEGSLLCHCWPWNDVTGNTGLFVLRYSIEQLFPSVVWMSQDANMVAHSLGLEPAQILQDLTGQDVYSANILLFTTLLSTSRYFFAGFMMIAQLIRAANVSIGTFAEYEQRIQLGREPPLLTHQLVVRLCGRDSHVSELSLKRMGMHIFPVFEDPQRVQFLVWKHSEQKRRPIYWCVSPGLYGSLYSWDRFPADASCFMKGIHNPDDNILVLEADATNGNDPLTIGEKAMDLTLEDASQGFRRILERYAAQGLIRGKDFRTLRVYLGNSMETATTGGGHLYTLRHRIHYAKEIDVLIDSRAPVLYNILEWCEAATEGRERKLFFQTSSREYFLNLQKLLKEYGYEIYDPLDLRMLSKMRAEIQQENSSSNNDNNTSHNKEPYQQQEMSLMNALMDDPILRDEDWDDHRDFLEQFNRKSIISSISENNNNQNDGGGGSSGSSSNNDDNSSSSSNDNYASNSKSEMLRMVARMSKLPRLIHMKTTAETVNAVDALIMAGEVDAGNCCALIDREEGVTTLEQTLKQKEDFVQDKEKLWMRKSQKKKLDDAEKKKEDDDDDGTAGGEGAARKRSTAGLQIICSSSIHDDVLRQVRLWARYGYSASEIQREMDEQYQEILHKSFAVQRQVSGIHSTDHHHNPHKKNSSNNKKQQGGLQEEEEEEEEQGAPEVTPETTPDELTTSSSSSSTTTDEEETTKK